jgi:hypothetical protein
MSGTDAEVVDAAQRRNIPTALRVAQAASRVTGHHKLSGKSKGSVRSRFRDTPHTGTSLYHTTYKLTVERNDVYICALRIAHTHQVRYNVRLLQY